MINFALTRFATWLEAQMRRCPGATGRLGTAGPVDQAPDVNEAIQHGPAATVAAR